MARRQKSERLNLDCTQKGSTFYGCNSKWKRSGVIWLILWKFKRSNFCWNKTRAFSSTFQRGSNPIGKLFLQDGYPTQYSGVAKEAMSKAGAQLLHIPPRSPDLESIFKLIGRKLVNDLLKFKMKFFHSFS